MFSAFITGFAVSQCGRGCARPAQVPTRIQEPAIAGDKICRRHSHLRDYPARLFGRAKPRPHCVTAKPKEISGKTAAEVCSTHFAESCSLCDEHSTRVVECCSLFDEHSTLVVVCCSLCDEHSTHVVEWCVLCVECSTQLKEHSTKLWERSTQFELCLPVASVYVREFGFVCRIHRNCYGNIRLS